MKFSQIKKLCKDAQECVTYEDGPLTWLGTRYAAYPIEDVDIDTSSIKTLLDWPDVESDIGVEMIELAESTIMPNGTTRADVAFNHWVKLEQGMAVYYAGERINPLVHNGGVLFVEEDKIKPAIRRGEYLDFRLVYNQDDEPMVVITNGLIVTGIVRPLTVREAELILETMGKMAAMRPEGTPGDVKRRAKERAEEIDGQIAMDEMVEEMSE